MPFSIQQPGTDLQNHLCDRSFHDDSRAAQIRNWQEIDVLFGTKLFNGFSGSFIIIVIKIMNKNIPAGHQSWIKKFQPLI